MNSVRLFSKAKVAFEVFQPRFYVALSHLCHKNIGNFKYTREIQAIGNSHGPLKFISYCNAMQTESDSQSRNSDQDKLQKAVQDDEFKSILQDFTKDFGVDDESNKLLEDIRKNIDSSHIEKKASSGSHLMCSDFSDKSREGAVHQKYKDFSDADASVIYSIEEQQDEDEFIYHIDQEMKSKMSYVDLKRGLTGVFDLDELIDVLRNENLMDITAISIPKEMHYADYLVLVTAKSIRHSSAITELILKLYKQKKNRKDPFIKVEGDKNTNWKAIDLGNIVFHIFLEETRALYDIESLWLLDSEFDTGGNIEIDPMMKILEEQLEFFNSLQQSNDEKKDS